MTKGYPITTGSRVIIKPGKRRPEQRGVVQLMVLYKGDPYFETVLDKEYRKDENDDGTRLVYAGFVTPET